MEERRPNRLIETTSPYLQQHAYNPVDWYPWGPEALEKARREDKPIFLSIGYSTCHWCHVMAHECFEDQAIAAVLNEHFVSIKVDREERPDLDETYMNVVHRPHRPRRLAPERLPHPGPEALLRRHLFSPGGPGRPARLSPPAPGPQPGLPEKPGADRRIGSPGHQPPAGPGGDSRGAAVNPPGRRWTGGRRSAPAGARPGQRRPGRRPQVSPVPGIRLFCCTIITCPGDPEVLDKLGFTLEKMARGGIYDQLGGGFHRYAVDDAWVVPHFEKMLYDNALLTAPLPGALPAHRQPPEPQRIAAETLDFVLRELQAPGAASMPPGMPTAKGWKASTTSGA